MKKIILSCSMILCAALPLTAAAGPQERGMLAGAAIGATAGAFIGTETNEAAEGAMIGAMFGAVAGALLSDMHVQPVQRPQRIVYPVRQYQQRDQYRDSPHRDRFEVKHKRAHKQKHEQARRSHKHHVNSHASYSVHRSAHYQDRFARHQGRVIIPSRQYRHSEVHANARLNRSMKQANGNIKHYAKAD